MKRKVALLGALASLATAVTLLIAPATGSAWPGNGAGWQGDNSGLPCNLYDGNGNLVPADAAKLAVGDDGSVTLICKAKGVANDTGHAVTYSGFACNVNGTITTDSHNTVSKTGNATLICYVAPPPPCTAGSEDFSGDAEFSQPTTFAGGTIDTAYGTDGSVRVQGSSWGGAFADGTHLLFSGFDVNSFQLTFTNAVSSVELDASSNVLYTTTNLTLTGYDASNNVVDSETLSNDQTGGPAVDTLAVSSTSNNIAYFTIATDDPLVDGVGFTNINWGCTS